jgi:hypothetical protein
VVSEQGLSVYGGRKSVENNGGFVKKKCCEKEKEKTGRKNSKGFHVLVHPYVSLRI